MRSAAALHGWERRRERAERVEHDLPPDMVSLYRRIKRAGMTARDVVEYVESHPQEWLASVEALAARRLELLMQDGEVIEVFATDPDVEIVGEWLPLARMFLDESRVPF